MIAISTCFKRALIGVSIKDKCQTFELDANCKHSENILLNIDKLLDNMEVSFAENDSYGVVVGPGSFTGVRISASLVKGFLAGNKDKKVVTLTSFDLMAYTYINQYKPQNDFVCVIDALSGYYFVCEYDKNGNKISEEKMIDKEQYLQLKQTVGLEEESVECEYKITPSAKDLLELSLNKYNANKFSKPEEILPLYLRKSQAEVSLEETTKKSLKN